MLFANLDSYKMPFEASNYIKGGLLFKYTFSQNLITISLPSASSFYKM